MPPALTRADVLGHRVRVQQLERGGGGTLVDTALLDAGVQDTGPDGGGWALAVRGLTEVDPGDLVLLWTLRGSPHSYRRTDVASVAAAVAPFSDADAGRRVISAAKPLQAAGIAPLEALDVAAAAMRAVVTQPTVKGEASARLTEALPEAYSHFCRPCGATHVFEMVFRLAAVRAGLELQPGTSPPVLQRIPGFEPAARPEPRHDVVRGYLHLLGPATPRHVAGFLDAPVRDVQARWPQDAVEVDVEGERRWMLADDVDALAGEPPRLFRLLGPYDLYVQGRDRDLLVRDHAQAKVLWPVLGRPGVVLDDGEVAGAWRPRQSGRRLRLQVTLFRAVRRHQLAAEAERLAGFRGVELTGIDVDGAEPA